MHSKVEAVACKTLKINIVFTVAVFVHVTKLVCQIDFSLRSRQAVQRGPRWTKGGDAVTTNEITKLPQCNV